MKNNNTTEILKGSLIDTLLTQLAGKSDKYLIALKINLL